MMFDLFSDKEDQPDPFAGAVTIEFESGDRCAVCGKYHADQWWCDPEIPNPWGATEEDKE